MKKTVYCYWQNAASGMGTNRSKLNLKEWQAYCAGRTDLPFQVIYFTDYKELKKAMCESPFTPVLMHVPDGTSQPECKSRAMLSKSKKIRFFMLNSSEDFADGTFSYVSAQANEQLAECLTYLFKQRLDMQATRLCPGDGISARHFGFNIPGCDKGVFLPIEQAA